MDETERCPNFTAVWTYHGHRYATTASKECISDNVGTGIGYPIKIPALYELHIKRISKSNTGSRVLVNTSVVQLIQEQPGVLGSRIIGAIIKVESGNGRTPVYKEVRARLVVFSTGGFQGSSSLTSRYLGQGGDNIFVRSNKGSVGDGINLATSVGAGTSRGMSTYYGHLLAAPLNARDVKPDDYLPLAQYRMCAAPIIYTPYLIIL